MINSNTEMLTMSSVNNVSGTTLLRKARPISYRLDYRIFNFCATCNLKLSKEILRCPDCKQKVRIKPWHRSNSIEHKRL
jgi:hypothetical protein